VYIYRCSLLLRWMETTEEEQDSSISPQKSDRMN
jgi:hypothetical protein